MLTARPGTWQGADSFGFSWLSCTGGDCTAVASGDTYRVRPEDGGHQLQVEVLATGPGGQAQALSARTSAVSGGPAAPAEGLGPVPAPVAPQTAPARPTARRRTARRPPRPRRARITLDRVARRLPSGGRLLVSGHLIPRQSAGKLIQLQWRYGSSWRLMTQGRVARGGRFILSYRFVRGGHYAIKVRVAVPADRGWAYRTTLSRPLAVRVG